MGSPRAQNAVTNLDQDLRSSRAQKYARSEPEVKLWVYKTLSVDASTVAQHGARGLDLMDILKDGELLCRLGMLVRLEANPCTKYKSSRMPFVQMENILFFLDACRQLNVPHDEIFQTVDLYERADPYQVVVTLVLFLRQAHANTATVEAMGPKKLKVRPPVPRKPLSLTQSR